MSWFWTLIFLTFITFSSSISLSEPKHQTKKLPSALLVGTVYCDACVHRSHPKPARSIAGASVEVACKETKSRRGFRQEAKTDSHGEFKIQLPFPVGKHVRKIPECSVRLIRSNDPLCAVAAASSSSLHLKSRKGGSRIFSAGFFSFRPQACGDQYHASNKQIDQFGFLPNPLNPPVLPPNPLLPPPSLLPPNPFQPPPSVIPPIFPTPPPSIFPPILPVPPTTPPFFNLPPLPGLVPSPPPPRPPTLPIPLPPLIPPFPFQPTPGFPGVPPARVSSTSP